MGKNQAPGVEAPSCSRRGRRITDLGRALEIAAKVARDDFFPAAIVVVALCLRVLAQRFPAAMDEAHARGAAFRSEAELEHGVRLGRTPRMPGPGKSSRGRPGEDAAPIASAAILRRFVDAAANAWFDAHGLRFCLADRVGL